MSIETPAENRILPIGFKFSFEIPTIEGSSFTIVTNREGETIFNTIYAFIRLAVDNRENIFSEMDLPDLAHNIASQFDLTSEEQSQYEFAGKALLPMNAYNRFLAMVISRLNAERIASIID